MDLTYIIIAAVILALPAFLTRLLSGGTRDTDKVLGAELRSKPTRATRRIAKGPQSPQAAQPRPAGLRGTIRNAQGMSAKVMQLVKSGQKLEAMKLLHQQTGMGLKQAKDLVDRLG